MKFKIFIFIVAIIIFSSFVSSASCNPEYSCPDWNACADGIQTRTCKEISCHLEPLVERRLCASDVIDCKVKYSCSDWSSCSYLDKTQDILNNKINFKGYQERACTDLNQCVESFAEQKLCEDSYKVKFIQVEQCGIPMLVALDSNSERAVSQINLDSWRSQRLDIAFVQNNFSYCPSCYNGFQDGDEQGIDCGLSCKSCVLEQGISQQILFISSSWILSAIILASFVLNAFFSRKTRLRYLIYRAYLSIEKKDKTLLKKNIEKIKTIYRAMSEKDKLSFKSDLDRLYRRI